MSAGFKIALGLFLLAPAVGIAFGAARDIFSVERRKVTGIIAAIARDDGNFKSNPKTPPNFKLKLADGRIVIVATRSTNGLSIGQTIEVSEMVMPWGQLWYRTKG